MTIIKYESNNLTFIYISQDFNSEHSHWNLKFKHFNNVNIIINDLFIKFL